MKIKCLILVFCCFVLCGCTAEVNLSIDEKLVKESVDITFYQNVLYPKELIKTSFRNYIPAFAKDLIVDTLPDAPLIDVEYYSKKETDLGNGYLFNYSYDFDINEYGEARTVKDGFRYYNVSFDQDEETITLSTDSRGLLYFDEYPELEEVTVNIKTDYLVRENNADRVNNNVYTWVLKKDDNKSINMLIDISDNSFYLSDTTITIIISVVVVVAFIFLLLLLKNKKNNKI